MGYTGDRWGMTEYTPKVMFSDQMGPLKAYIYIYSIFRHFDDWSRTFYLWIDAIYAIMLSWNSIPQLTTSSTDHVQETVGAFPKSGPRTEGKQKSQQVIWNPISHDVRQRGTSPESAIVPIVDIGRLMINNWGLEYSIPRQTQIMLYKYVPYMLHVWNIQYVSTS